MKFFLFGDLLGIDLSVALHIARALCDTPYFVVRRGLSTRSVIKHIYHSASDLGLARAIAIDVVRKSSIYPNSKTQASRSRVRAHSYYCQLIERIYPRRIVTRASNGIKRPEKERTLRQCTRCRNRRYDPLRNVAGAVTERERELSARGYESENRRETAARYTV